MEPQKTTLTYRVSAIEIKMLHFQFRMKKIENDQSLIQEKLTNKNLTNREQIRILTNSSYSIIDMLVILDNINVLMRDILCTEELEQFFDKDIFILLNNTKKICEKWRAVRNKLGAHLDIDIVEDLCKTHNLKGVFLSEDLETDLGMLNCLLIEQAINSTRKSNDIFSRDLNFKDNLIEEVKLVVTVLNKDWFEVFSYFEVMMKFIYKYGKEEKMSITTPEERKGIIRGD